MRGRTGDGSTITVALGQDIDLPPYREAIAARHRPGHVLLELAERTGGEAVSSFGARISLFDRLGGLLVGHARDWRVARRARAAAGDGFIYANGEAIGFALILLGGLRPSSARRVGFWVMTPHGRRVRRWLAIMRVLRLQPILAAESEAKARDLRQLAGDHARIATLTNPMDLEFFRAGGGAGGSQAGRDRPLLVSAGLEYRDYRTLVEAIAGMDLDLVIGAASPDAKDSSATMPDAFPPNVLVKKYPIEELRDLYLAADLIVVPTVENGIDAGSTTVMEGMASGTPVLTSAHGSFVEMAEHGWLVAAETGSVDSYRQTISDLLNRPEYARRISQQASAEMVANHSHETWLTLVTSAFGLTRATPQKGVARAA